jgi:hypothetical protein
MIILPLGYMKQCLKIEKHEKPQEILTLDWDSKLEPP